MTRLISSTLAMASLAGLAAATPKAAEGQRGWGAEQRGAPACAVYEHADFQGEARVFGRDAGEQELSGRWNDRVSSLRCRPGCQLTAYEHDPGRGAFHLFGGEVRDVGPFWNDKISRVRINCVGPDLGGSWGWDEERRGGGQWSDDSGRGGDWGRGRRARGAACTYYEHANYAGRREAVGDGQALSALPHGWNDVISSVQCRPGCELIAYEHVDYRGTEQRYRGDLSSLGPQWNDRISALRVQCRW